MTAILGISAFYHDSSAALIVDGKIVAAVQEERFSRIKHDPGFPEQSVQYCLSVAGKSLSEVDCVVFYEKPFLKFERLLETFLAYAPKGARLFSDAAPLWIKEKLFQKQDIIRSLKKIDSEFDGTTKLKFCSHHLSHCASAYYPSPFQDAAVLCIDGVGEWATTTRAFGLGKELEISHEIRFPHSLGLLYATFTSYLGFRVNFDEYKIMGLAPYGEPTYARKIMDHLIDVKPDGSFWLDQSYFDYAAGSSMFSRKFLELFGEPARNKDTQLEKFHMDIAASIQQVCEYIMLNLVADIKKNHQSDNLCMAGGVAQNSAAVGKIVSSGLFKDVWVQPAASDSGGALGAALAYWHKMLGNERNASPEADQMNGALLGPSFSQSEIERRLENTGAKYQRVPERKLLQRVAKEISKGRIVGWFDGRMEFGARALGSRSILADPRSETMRDAINLQVKFRESFRPFAPAILIEEFQKWFELAQESPYMGIVAQIRSEKRKQSNSSENSATGFEKMLLSYSEIPAVTHVDYSARVQTVSAATNQRFHDLIKEFHALTGVPLLLNTSLNGADEPIVCTPEEAYHRFTQSGIDILVCGNCLISK